MKNNERTPITSENLDQAIKQLARLKVWYSSWSIAAFVSSILSFVLSFFVGFILYIGAAGLTEELSDWDSTPVMRSIALFAIEHMSKLPEAWYIRLAVSLLILLISMFVLYQLVTLILVFMLTKRPAKLILPKKTIPKAKKLYKIARGVDNSPDKALVLGAVIPCAALFLMLVADQLETYTLQESIDYGGLVGSILAYVIGICIMLLAYGYFNAICLLISEVPFRKRHDKYDKQCIDLESELYKYWISVDPVKAARVAEEERKRAEERRRLDSMSWGAGLAIYEQYKSDAARSMGYSSGSVQSSSGLTEKDHDELDAVLRAAHHAGKDFHSGV